MGGVDLTPYRRRVYPYGNSGRSTRAGMRLRRCHLHSRIRYLHLAFAFSRFAFVVDPQFAGRRVSSTVARLIDASQSSWRLGALATKTDDKSLSPEFRSLGENRHLKPSSLANTRRIS